MIAYQIIPRNIICQIANLLQVNRIIGFYPFFLLGYLLKQNYTKIETKYSVVKSRILCVCILSLYTFCCIKCEGLVWNSGFYLVCGTGMNGIVRIILSYIFISSLAFAIIFSVPNKNYVFTKYGMRTMNVYLLHMLIVFPISYGVFSKQPDNISMIFFNSIVCVFVCALFFSDTVNRCMEFVLTNKKWIFSILLWGISLGIVNSHGF